MVFSVIRLACASVSSNWGCTWDEGKNACLWIGCRCIPYFFPRLSWYPTSWWASGSRAETGRWPYLCTCPVNAFQSASIWIWYYIYWRLPGHWVDSSPHRCYSIVETRPWGINPFDIRKEFRFQMEDGHFQLWPGGNLSASLFCIHKS